MISLDKNRKEQTLYKIFSFYNSKVNPKIPRYQKAVFRYFGFHINQVIDENYPTHGDFLNHICKTITDAKYLIIFDIDCIPIKKNWFSKLMKDLEQPRTIVGAAQTANHLQEGKNLYVSPFFFAIPTAYLKELDYPDMNMTDDMDAGQNLTKQIIKNGGHIKYWWPTDIEEKKWDLYHPEYSKFGPGTTYNDCIYHAFFSRFDLADRFVIKAKSILPEIVKLYLRIVK